MNIFETVKTNTDMISVAEKYGAKINSNGIIKCIFHNDKNPSMKLYRDHFHCFACGAHGDAIAYTAQRFGISQYKAAQKLAADFELEVYAERKIPDTHENELISLLKRNIDQLRLIRDKYCPGSPDEDLHPLYVRSVQQLPLYEYYLSILEHGTEDERMEFTKHERRLVYGLRKTLRESGMAV